MIGLVLASVIETKQQIQPTSDHNRVERQHVKGKIAQQFKLKTVIPKM